MSSNKFCEITITLHADEYFNIPDRIYNAFKVLGRDVLQGQSLRTMSDGLTRYSIHTEYEYESDPVKETIKFLELVNTVLEEHLPASTVFEKIELEY